MKPAPFAYKKARSLEEAVALLGEHKDARLLAGGQSLIATLNMRLSAPSLLIDINGISGLDGIAHKDGKVEIGALVRHAQAERSELIAKHAPLIARAMPHIGHPAIRNRGTLGGSIAFADPAAELPACLLALDGEVEATGPKGKRTIQAEDFFKGLFETALRPQEMLTAIRVPAAGKRHARRLCRIGAPARRLRHRRPRRQRARRRQGTERRAAGLFRRRRDAGAGEQGRSRARRAAIVDAAVAALDLDPQDDVQATGAVKKHLAGVLLRRVAAAIDGGAGMSEHALDISLTVNGERVPSASSRARRWSISCARIWPHRQPCRLRARRLRRLHRARRTARSCAAA